ncbi:Ni/Fe hydrogenase subunit alpha [Sulfurirhabdus autotrophica]|uniref:Coenzyme F420-reducing hydrogenase alpha subunit n=1 Tax=Sulfurirhabdus autotrophica TaxID=1706046 RepID=A0A4R3YE73_9PROT|nr:nickel-dependent hydrogenase large subunit [Sulfurirhabdus autotrophica]TCV90350.1 coenzyme F420-reducing hydrogenase alpha subunit [Sulfurirhabdus autotrophica]
MNDQRRDISITVPILARVEGEGALSLKVKDGRISELNLRIFEPPRLFEKLLEGRRYEEVPDMVARICGICPVAYQMSASHAIESIFGTTTSPWVRAMRRLFYCGEWIESHSLHIHLLAAPDYLGFNSAPEMAKDYPDEVRRGLRLQGLGNDIISFLGGRSVNPVGARVGGFYHAPAIAAAQSLLQQLKTLLPEAEALVRWTGGLNFPAIQQDFECVSLSHPDEYPMNEGRLVSSRGMDIAISDFENEFIEHQVPYSTALHCLHNGKPYLVGPLARLNLNWDKLPASVRKNAESTGITWPSQNVYHSLVARAIEIHYAFVEAIRLLEAYELPNSSYSESQPKAGTGYGCTEAPRGILWHKYEMDGRGQVVNARIVPPTSQNQARIEEDLKLSIEQLGFDQPDDIIRHRAETVIRNYDPCISCATHFLDLRVERE